MSRVRSINTTPELAVRSLVHRLGFRFRLHARALPGRPDLVLASHRKAIFVDGCFWHRHEGCRFTTTPKSRRKFWVAKFEANIVRDRRVRSALKRAGWKVLAIWQCETVDEDRLRTKLERFLLAGISRGGSR